VTGAHPLSLTLEGASPGQSSSVFIFCNLGLQKEEHLLSLGAGNLSVSTLRREVNAGAWSGIAR
jgi:hypothetical protein